MTVNLQGPIVVNKKTRIGRQCISIDDTLQVRHNLLEEMAHVSSKTC